MYRMYAWLCAGFALSLVLMSARPVLAADTSYLTLAGPNPASGNCPMTLTFNGSIVGPGNSSVTYLWARFVNGKPVDSAPTTNKIPAGGTLTLPPQSLVVDKASAGFQSYALFITAPAGSDSTTHGKVFFTVNCTIAFVHASTVQCAICPKPVPPPVNVQDTATQASAKNETQPQVCSDHGGIAAGLLCPDIIGKGYLILVWDWNANSDYPGIDGFNIYEVDHGQHKHVATQTTAPMTMTGLQPPSGGFSGRCYTVTSYKGNVESADSAQFCESGNVGATYANLFNVNWAYRFQHHVQHTSGAPDFCGRGLLCVGFYHYSQNGVTALDDRSEVYIYRGYLLYDQSQLAGMSVLRATLTLRNGDLSNQAGVNPSNHTCVSQISAATGDWTGNTNYVDGDWIQAAFLGSTNGDDTYDVTSIVQGWANGSVPNYGFVLRNTDEDLGAFDRAICLVGYGNRALLQILHV